MQQYLTPDTRATDVASCPAAPKPEAKKRLRKNEELENNSKAQRIEVIHSDNDMDSDFEAASDSASEEKEKKKKSKFDKR